MESGVLDKNGIIDGVFTALIHFDSVGLNSAVASMELTVLFHCDLQQGMLLTHNVHSSSSVGSHDCALFASTLFGSFQV